MTHMNADTRATWQNVANNTAVDRPSAGKTVTIVKGRKHKNKTGVVVWHGINKFYDTRYDSPAMASMREIIGREGYSVKVKTASGETFFVPAEYTFVEVEYNQPQPAKVEETADIFAPLHPWNSIHMGVRGISQYDLDALASREENWQAKEYADFIAADKGE